MYAETLRDAVAGRRTWTYSRDVYYAISDVYHAISSFLCGDAERVARIARSRSTESWLRKLVWELQEQRDGGGGDDNQVHQAEDGEDQAGDGKHQMMHQAGDAE